jgi:hypothetical protein
MLKESMRVEMIENCKDNPNIKAGWTGTIEMIYSDGSIEIEFDNHVTGNGISGNYRNNHFWYVNPFQIREI